MKRVPLVELQAEVGHLVGVEVGGERLVVGPGRPRIGGLVAKDGPLRMVKTPVARFLNPTSPMPSPLKSAATS